MLGGELISLGDFRGASVAAIEGLALGEQVGAGSAVDGAVDAAAAEKRLVCGVDDGVDGEGGDVGADEGDAGVVGVVGGSGGGGGRRGELACLVESGDGGHVGKREDFGRHFGEEWHVLVAIGRM